MKAYLYWYKLDQESPTEYIYIIALSFRQANYFWLNYLRNTLGWPYDYDLSPVNSVNESDFVKVHQVGDILGQDATL